MECFRQIWRCMKAPFTTEERVLEIGLPTDFRKEETPACFSDADMLMYQDRRGSIMIRNGTTIEMTDLQPLMEEKMQAQVREMSVEVSSPASDRG
ncbi:uncharacterized protein N7503_005620 [Penicillium pulvis]|uniref:uncharacterized protein n=1 Tax=Penicillium pulvis TaxID=1562058 RepID=UPI002547EE46|nr:uncharacterized protein N7503_005620 [Penicillium pulvis]KAJ5803170.1 hypothetical protein N7503_005620 [Penicillium pulvis]